MFQRLITFVQAGLAVQKIYVEVDMFSGLPCLNILGLTEAASRDVREKIRSALSSIGYSLPARKITVNLAADPPETGPRRRLPADGLDLPIALGILCADGRLPSVKNESVAVVGNLSLDGSVRPVSGIRRLSSILRSREKNDPLSSLLFPRENSMEASLISGVHLLPVDTLSQAVDFWRNMTELDRIPFTDPFYRYPSELPLLAIRGQESGKRALIVACTGFHNLLFSGPPGCGKTLLAQAASVLLPPPDPATKEKILMVCEPVEDPDAPGLCFTRPVRQPHHSLTTHALTGGGHPIVPGELTLADGGLLILDEMAEFSGMVLENLRQPLESHRIVLSYVGETRILPADFMMIGTMNLCPCGQFPSEKCVCRPSVIRRYQNRLGGPLIDRMDLCLTLNPVSETETGTFTEVEVQMWKDRILDAYLRQCRRYKDEPFSFNSRIPPDKIGTYISLSSQEESLFRTAARRFGLSLRQQHNTLKTARSIADLAGSDRITQKHLAEALGYRPRGYLVN